MAPSFEQLSEQDLHEEEEEEIDFSGACPQIFNCPIFLFKCPS
jgi:hypothetical protein